MTQIPHRSHVHAANSQLEQLRSLYFGVGLDHIYIHMPFMTVYQLNPSQKNYTKTYINGSG